jgi:hypothetical protein
VIAGWVLAILWFGILLSIIFHLGIASPIGEAVFSRPIYLCVLLLLAGIGGANLALYLAVCPRCSRKLFSDAQRGPFGKIKQRDYRARPFLFSFRNGAILTATRTGEVQCMWCGYQLGTKLDYTVKPQ